jgi:hypothetical protein
MEYVDDAVIASSGILPLAIPNGVGSVHEARIK